MKTMKSDIMAHYKGHIVALVAITIILTYFGLGSLQNASAGAKITFGVYAIFCAVIAALASTLIKVTQFQKHLEHVAAIQKAECELGTAAIKAHCIVSMTDGSDRIVEVNQKFLETFEYQAEDVIGKSTRILNDPVSDKSVFTEIHSTLLQGQPWIGEHSAVTKSGKRKFFQATVIPLVNEHGQHVKTISLRTDVTKQRSAEADRQMRAMLDDLQDELYIYRVSDLAITYVNKRACDRCEWDPQNCLGKRITDTDPNFNEDFFRKHVQPLVDGDKKSVVIQVQQIKGPVEISTRLHKGTDGETVFVSVLRDIKDRKSIERAKMSSVSVVSHELRTPLTSISGSLRMLQSKFQQQLAGPGAGLVDLAMRNCDRLMIIVNDILDLEKIESGEAPFEKAPFDLNLFAKEAIEVNQGYGDEFGVSFELKSDVKSALVYADATRLMQAISNLLSNAAKYSNDGDTVVVSITDSDSDWRLTVSDKGPGIAEDVQHLLFNSFSQLAPSDGKKRPGTGLGLAITKTIVQKNGGRCGIESEVGAGSQFYFDLPKLQRTA